MVSTFIDYRQLTNNFKGSLERVAASNAVSRETQYYKDNIGKVTSVEEFVDNYRLFSFAMKAHGLEDMTYAKAFMKKVLESDLTDDNSYANRLSDDRYRNFAAAYQFGSSTTVAQTSGQMEDLIAEHKQTIEDQNTAIENNNAYFKAAIGSVTSVDQLLSNDRLRDYVLKAFDVDTKYWSRDHLKKVLTSDLNDPASYVNTLAGASANDYKALAAAFNFNASGTLDSGVAIQNADQTTATVQAYTYNVPTRPLPVVAKLDADYYAATIQTVANVDGLVNDPRLLDFVKITYGLPSDTLKSTVKNILTSDLGDPNNYATTFGGVKFENLAKAFNFQPDGSIPSGLTAQNATQVSTATARYMTVFDDSQEDTDAGTYDFYKGFMGTIDSVDDLMSTSRIYNFVLTAFGFDPKVEKRDFIAKVLTSDLGDPNSVANSLKDPRYAEMARMFNFDAEGNASVPSLAQSQSSILQTSKDYVINKTRFGNADKKEAAQKEASYFNDQMQKIDGVDELLADQRLVDLILESRGLDPDKVSIDFMKRIFASDIADPESFVNQQEDLRFRDIVASFNFDPSGKVIQSDENGIQSRADIYKTEELYLRQSLEEQSGETNPGVRLALYFARMAPDINSAYDILGDQALLEVFRTAFDLPAEMSSMDIDKQAALVEKNLKLEDLQDKDKLDKFMSRFTALYDLANDPGSTSTVSLYNGSASISADTLFSIAQLKYS